MNVHASTGENAQRKDATMAEAGNAMSNSNGEGMGTRDTEAMGNGEREAGGGARSAAESGPDKRSTMAGINAADREAIHIPWAGIPSGRDPRKTGTEEQQGFPATDAPFSGVYAPQDAPELHADAIAPPVDLQFHGLALWNAITKQYILNVGEWPLLREFCHVADDIARLRTALARADSLIVKGSTGQDRAHPLLAEIRASTTIMIRIQDQLALPDPDEIVGRVGATPESRRQARRVNERWRRDFVASGEAGSAVDHGD